MEKFLARARRLAIAGTFAVAAVLVGGCGQKTLPTTYPATGTVVWADGKPVTGGMVEFRQAADPTLSTVGHLQPDGSFALSTLFGSDKIPGATEGQYEVTVLPASSGHARMSFALPDKYDIKAGQENRFTIKLDATQPKD